MVQLPKTVDAIYEDYKKRREALVTALTDDVTTFYEACDPQRQNLCLYGNSDGTWSVDLPAAEVPPELPEPVLGINFARDGMDRKDWLALCAVHSDAWLMSVVFFFAARFNEFGRAQIFSLVNQHPTVYEVVTGKVNRNKIYKRKAESAALAPSKAAALPPKHAPQYIASEKPLQAGQPLTHSEVNASLAGRQAELLWPDDGKWYLVQIQEVDLETKRAKVQYATGEEETLDLEEVINDKQMNMLT